VRGLIVGALLAAIVVACVHAPPKDTRQQKMTEIISLWTQIRGFRHDAGMPLDPSHMTEIQFKDSDKSVSEARRACPADHVVPKTCGDVCSLGTAICDNAEAICGLADQLGKDDQQAQEKCTSAKASCREASQRCCTCSKNPPKDSTTTPDNTTPSPMPALPTTPAKTPPSPLPAPTGAPHP
jgi:hypothetical protein